MPWCGDAFYLGERPVFSLDPLLHAGAYYVQDPSAMFVGSVAAGIIKASEVPLKVLDLCAAPGGKSTSIAAALRPSDLQVANEVIGSRASVLAENMVKWGSVNTVVTNSDPKDFERLGGWFDLIVADVPCSGEGMFRKEPASIAEWSPDNVKLCAARQRRIVADVWPALREGGYLIYSTCTFNAQENDDNAEWICREFGAEVIAPDSASLQTSFATGQSARRACSLRELVLRDGATSGAIETRCGLQFAPGITRGEGQYVAVLRKVSPARQVNPKVSKAPKRVVCGLVQGDMEAVQAETSAGTLIKAFPSAIAADIRFVEERLKAIRSGVAVAAVKGRDLIPQADLALSQAFNRGGTSSQGTPVAEGGSEGPFPQVELTLEQALQFLRCEALRLPDAPKGFITVTYEHLPLGFVKNLGTRANNLFPQVWRLRM